MTRADLSWIGPLAGVFLFIGLMFMVAVRRAWRIRNRTVDLSDQHERLMIYAQARLAAQREQASAAKADTVEAQTEHLRTAIEHWRQAIRNRRPDDSEAYQDIIAQIAMLEEDLSALAPDGAAGDVAQEES